MIGLDSSYSHRWIARVLGVSLVLFLVADRAEAAYELPTIWNDGSGAASPLAKELPASLSDDALFWPEFTPAHFRRAMRDEEGRIADAFRIPPAMEDHVRFWLKVYTFYSSQTLVIYDDRHPEVIYEVMDFRELATEKSNPVVYELLRERKIEARIEKYREAFRKLISEPNTAQPTRETRNILQAVAQSRHQHPLAVFAERIRGQTGQRDEVLRGLRRADRFMPVMESIFQSRGLPKELVRIAIVESSFNPRAISRSGATGVWQFMEASGREFMTVSPESGIDERLSPLKSTVAAAKLLRRNMSVFRSWAFAVTSYNSGLRNLLRIPHESRRFTRVGEILTRCDRRHGLGYAGQNYYAEFLAMLHAERYRELFFPSLSRTGHGAVRVAFRELRNRKTAIKLARELGISAMVLQELNPDIRSMRAVLPRGFRYAVPAPETDLSLITGSRGKLLSSKPAEKTDT